MSESGEFRICFLGGTRYSQPLDATSEKKFRLLAEAAGIFVIGFAQNLKPCRFRQHARFYLLPRLPLAGLRYLLMLTAGAALALWLILRHGIRIIVAQSPYEGFAGAVAKRLAGLLGRQVALIVESHGDFEQSLFLQRRVKLPSLYRILMRWTAGYAFKHADILRAVSDSTKEQLKRWAPGKPIVQFPAWTDIEAFLNASPEPPATAVLYAGVLTPLKGVHVLLDAFAKVIKHLPEARLWIAGREENKEYAAALRQQVVALRLNERVEFTGEVPQQELARYMARCRVFVLPSLSEALGRVVFEAMAAGKPVIGSAVGGIPEMVQDGVTGFLVPPGDPETLADRLSWLLTHPEEAAEMGKRAKAFAEKFFSPAAYQQAYRELFAKAIETLPSGQ
ncbi:glycosyltransferase involved in cell wall biosynthesis [Thermodesulfitimonas autotrophica]|uniref:Glycosyltransferase involved in cell wall biosynthesis n=1 Tax=Thermodesulfitimonas autotrophica TaxID=1894989 RepID=A0A3N5BMQ5_9THEO|nr:glycosyltransferase [Thermodesulfitimonas autotrophica]RPF47015.1 glycosyltransferase involved in cell wall biosynthesis [Thermodesulfitimonas autotrophica]